MLKNFLSFLFLMLFMLGCEQKHFSHVYDKKEIGANIHLISITSLDTNNSKIYITKLKDEGFKLDEKSHYKLQTDSKLYPKRCNNPLATAEQKSYIGFVQLTLFKDGKKIYMCQSDFRKIQEIENIIEGLIKIMKKEMKILFSY
jgi:hypothetical protein